MSESLFAALVTALILVVLFAWVPALELICPPCGRALKRFKRRERETLPTALPVQDELGVQQPTGL
jgi:hypothetical protein